MPKGVYIRKESTKLKMSMSATNTEESVWKYIQLGAEDKCWNYLGPLDKDGYGLIMISWKSYRAHRVVYKLINGLIPHNLFILHTCDNPSCCNPKHLFIGSGKDNMKDMVTKDRNYFKSGERHPYAKLTYIQVIKIRYLYDQNALSQRQLAKKYNVSRSCIVAILHQQSWKGI